jgi:hypothetical protein
MAAGTEGATCRDPLYQNLLVVNEGAGGELCIGGAAELLDGLAKSGGGEQRRKALNWFLLRLKVLAWGQEEAVAYGLLRARQGSMGRPLAGVDCESTQRRHKLYVSYEMRVKLRYYHIRRYDLNSRTKELLA